MQYAFDEFWNILRKLPASPNRQDSLLQYLCALVAELTYYHVPAFEFDIKKRAMLLPCLGWQEIYRSGRITNLEIFLNSSDFEGRYFIVVERNVIAVGLAAPPHLFIGFRGTRFGFDWRINLKSRLSRVGVKDGMVHEGFAIEALRISEFINDNLERINRQGKIEHTFLTGHSLGGAIAVLSRPRLSLTNAGQIIVFGSPRYGDLEFCSKLPKHNIPLQIRREGDMVPSVPPVALGYCDHPYQIDSFGGPVLNPYERERWSSLSLKWASFLGRAVAPHSMDGYRHDLGTVAGVSGYALPLVPFEKLRREDIC
jgi:Lipase (class 3)